MKQFVYAGKSSLDFNIGLSAGSTFDAPARDLSFVSVPGRNGDIIIDNGRYNNIDVTYPCWIAHDLNKWLPAFRSFCMQFSDYQRLEDDYNPEYYRLGILTSALTVKTGTANRNANFDLTFNCKPQRHLKDGEKTISITNSTKIYNTTNFDAKPKLTFFSTGAITINGWTVQITQTPGASGLTLDAETGTWTNPKIISSTNKDLPVLKPGENMISLSGLSRVDIVPRWWTL